MAKKTIIPIVELESAQGKRLIKLIKSARVSGCGDVLNTVGQVLKDIQAKGDRALFEYTKKFDKKVITEKNVSIEWDYIDKQSKRVPKALKTTIREAAKRIREYHTSQKINTDFTIKTREGKLSQITRPIERVGVYIPGGYTVYPSTVLMDIIPAVIAGVKEIVAVTPPHDELDPAVAYILKLFKIKEVYRVGGAQAIGALAYGTRSIAAVDKIVGPGNAYVSAAKKMVYGTVDIDSVAGPSEVAVIADNSVDPSWVALDLLSQAEHGSGDEIVVCVTENKQYAERVRKNIIEEIEATSLKEVFKKLKSHAITIFICRNRDESIAFINDFAPEHLQIMTRSYTQDMKKIRNAAAIFLGPYTPVALGDYFVGTNHVLPTGSAARYASPLGVESFIKRQSVAEVTKSGLKMAAAHVSRFANAEKFVYHAISVERRLEKL